MNHEAGPDADGVDGTAPAEPAAGSGLVDRSGDAEITDAAKNSAREPDAGPPTSDAAPAEGAAAESAQPDPAAEMAEPARPETGEPRVDAALTLLDHLADLPVTEHAAVFERVHAELTAVLGQLDPESADGDD